MAAKKPVEKEEEVDPCLTDNIYNLAATFSILGDIDSMLMDDEEQDRLKEMKARVFNAMENYCKQLK